MTKDELLGLAIEAGEYADTHHEQHGSWLDAERHQFANLVTAAEREACEKSVIALVHGNVTTCAAAIRQRSQS